MHELGCQACKKWKCGTPTDPEPAAAFYTDPAGIEEWAFWCKHCRRMLDRGFLTNSSFAFCSADRFVVRRRHSLRRVFLMDNDCLNARGSNATLSEALLERICVNMRQQFLRQGCLCDQRLDTCKTNADMHQEYRSYGLSFCRCFKCTLHAQVMVRLHVLVAMVLFKPITSALQSCRNRL